MLFDASFLSVFVLLGLFLVQTECNTLRGLFAVFRHGNRAPYAFYSGDPYGNLNLWPNGLAQITKRGEEQGTRIGEYLKMTYYADLKINDTNQIEIRTTEVERVRKTAENVFKGFVTNTPLEQSSQFMPLRMDLTIPRFNKCPGSVRENRRLKELQSNQDTAKRNAEIFRKMSDEHNITFPFLVSSGDYKASASEDAFRFHRMVEAFQLEMNEGFDLPNWLSPELLRKLDLLDSENFNVAGSSKRLNQINAGPVFYDFGEKIKKLVKPKSSAQDLDFLSVNDGGKEPKRLTLYAGTDIVLNNLLTGLRAFDPIHHLTPPPACVVIIELHEDLERTDLVWDERSFVRVLYFGSYETIHPIDSEPQILQNVTVRTFLASISDLSLNRDEWVKACYNMDAAGVFQSDTYSDRTTLLVIIVVLAVLSALLLITLCIFKRNFNNKRKVSFNYKPSIKT